MRPACFFWWVGSHIPLLESIIKDPQFCNSLCPLPSPENVLPSWMKVLLKSRKEGMVNCVWGVSNLQGREALKMPSHQELQGGILLLWGGIIAFVLSLVLTSVPTLVSSLCAFMSSCRQKLSYKTGSEEHTEVSNHHMLTDPTATSF